MDFEHHFWKHAFEALAPVRCEPSPVRTTPIRKLALAAVVLGSIGGGALVGAALMAWMTPTTGRDIRRKLAHVLTTEAASNEGYDSGEYVVDLSELEEHPASTYPATAQPANEDDARALDDGDPALDATG